MLRGDGKPMTATAAIDRRRIRVLRIIARLNVGGPALHGVILNDGLQRRGFETLLAYGAHGPDEGSLDHLPRDRGLSAVYVPALGRSIRPWNDAQAFVAVRRLIREWRPDVVHTHTAKAGALGRLAAALSNATKSRRARCAVVHTFHGHVFSGYFGRATSFAVRIAERGLSRVTDRIVTISESQRRDIVERYRIAAPERVTVVPLGLELERFRECPVVAPGARARLGLKDDEFVVGYVGRLVPIKDVGTLIRAVALARRRVPRVRLLVAGDGECRRALQQIAASLDLADAAIFLGWRDDVVALYASMDMFALSSLNEGTPVSLIEALAAGLPVVATDVGGVRDVLREGRLGALVPPRHPEGLADRICEVAQDRAAARLQAESARQDVRARYGADQLTAQMAALYEEVLDMTRGFSVASPGVVSR